MPGSASSVSPERTPEALFESAIVLHQAGRLADAARAYETVRSQLPEHFDATHLLGVIALQEGRYAQAQLLIQAAVQIEPNNLPALNNLATAYLRDGQLQNALAAAERGFQLMPESLEVLINLGSILHQMRRFREALLPLQRAYDINPDLKVVCSLLGACLLKVGDPRAALRVYESAASASPDDGDVLANLSVALNANKQHQKAVESAQRALAIRSDSVNALDALAAAQFEMGQIDDAIATYRHAVSLTPSGPVLCSFANALITSGLHAEALECARRAIALSETNTVAQWLFAVAQIMPMCASREEIERSRAAFKDALAALQSWHRTHQMPESYRAVGATQPFYLAYQPFNNRELLRLYGDVCVEFMASLPIQPKEKRTRESRDRKLRVGFASTHMRNHSVWVAVAKGWVENLDTKQFDIHLFSLSAERDSITEDAKRRSIQFEDRPTEVSDWTEAIQKAELDLIIYPAIGMDVMTSQLASLRLAPRQATTWGHPETSGLSTIDYYLSGELLEPPGAQNNYSEELVRLPNLSVFVEQLQPKIVDPNLNGLGLPGDEPLVLCPGSPFKYSVLNDWVWVQIARGMRSRKGGRLVFFAGRAGAMYDMLEARLRAAFSDGGVDFEKHVKVIPQLDRPRFFGLMQRSALMLDTLGFSGFNTALQAIEAGLPILTFDGEFMRGRLASCFMRRMEIPELIATNHQDFIDRAIDLVQDGGKRQKLSKRIIKRRRLLFEDIDPVRKLEQFVRKAAEDA